MKKSIILPLLSCICILSVIAMISALVISGNKTTHGSFVPPEFDSCAETGIPNVPDHLGYSEIYQEGMDFRVHICGKAMVTEQQAELFFTNDAENHVWMKLRLLDEKGNIIGETGLIRPGEYIRMVKLCHTPSEGSMIQMKVMAYEPDTYYSAGSVTLKTVIEIL